MICIFRNKRFLALSVLLLSLGMWGCVITDIDYVEPGNGDDKDVTITVSIPGAKSPSTRSIADAGGEAAVNTIDILVFKDGGSPSSPKILSEHIKGTIVPPDNGENNKNDNYLVKFKAKLSPNSTASRISIIANASDEVNAAVATAGGVDTASKLAVLENLQFASENSGGMAEGWKWGAADSDNFDHIPMYGEAEVSGITPAMNITGIQLTRMLARIDVVNNAVGFTLSEVYLVNYNTAGYISPAWNNANGEMLAPSDSGYPYDDNADPALPSAAGPKTGASNAMMYNYATLATSEGMLGEIYTYEAHATTGAEGNAGHTDAVCLIVKGTFNSTVYYYRIDFTSGTDKAGNKPNDSGFDPSKVEYMPVYRNHNYVFTISRVDGAGYAQFGDALKSLGIMNNLQTTFHSADENGLVNYVYNGQHYLGLGEDVTIQALDTAGQAPCATNYAYGWQIDTSKGTNGIEYADSSDTGWISASKEGGVATDKSANILLETHTYNYTNQDRVAYVNVIAGRLNHRLKVTQKPIAFQNRMQWSTYPFAGAFWKHDQKGERVITGLNTGAWSVTVDANGTSWLSVTATPSPDKNILTDNPGNPEDYYNGSDGSAWTTSISGTGNIYFRVCTNSTFVSYDADHNPARYATITVTTTGGTKTLYMRQGEGDDYLMRDGDAGTTILTSGSRPHAAKYSPYNLTCQDFLSPVETESVEVSAHGGKLVEYPSQAGALWQFAVKSADNTAAGTKPYIYAWSPSNPVTGVAPVIEFSIYFDETYWGNNSTLTDYNNQTLASLYETCPPGYRRPTDGSDTNTAAVPMPDENNSEMRQSLWLNPPRGNTTIPDTNLNVVWGYYADGFFDRRSIGALQDGQSNSAVNVDKSTIAYIGKLFYNPYNYASLFFPAAGIRPSGGFLYYSGSHGYYSSASSSEALLNPRVWNLEFYQSGTGQGMSNRVPALSIRCVKESD